MAGVVNIKTWKDYRGAQLTLQYGNTQDKDAGLYSGDILFGTGDDKMSITGDIFYYHHNSMFNIDRGNSLKPPFLSSNTTPWNFNLSRNSVEDALGLQRSPLITPENNPAFFHNVPGTATPVLTDAGLDFVNNNYTNFPNGLTGSNIGVTNVVRDANFNVVGRVPANLIYGTPPTGSNGTTPANGYIYARARPRGAFSLLPGFNFNAFSGSFPDQERWGGYASFNDKICDDQFQIFGDFYYADVKTHDELAPGATNNFQTKGQGTIYVPPHSDLNGVAPPQTPTFSEVGLVDPHAFNPFNPYDQIISGGTRARLYDFGNRLFDNENFAWASTVGAHGDKLFNGTWGYDSAFRYSQIENVSRIKDTNVLRFNQVMNAERPDLRSEFGCFYRNDDSIQSVLRWPLRRTRE